MYAIVTKKDSNEIELTWLADKIELSDGALVCQNESEVTTFEDITSLTHTVTEFNGSLPSDFQPEGYMLVEGELVKK